jgi:hypothetical protein
MNEEQSDMMPIHAEERVDAVREGQLYSETHPERNIPSTRTEGNICRNLTETEYTSSCS